MKHKILNRLYEAERRVIEEAQRKREEEERIEAERRKAEQDRKFAEERDAAAKSLKGFSPPGRNANTFGLKGIGPSSGELRTLQPRADFAPSPAIVKRREELDRQIKRDAEAIRRLGFARREEDFAEWQQLSAKAKADFEGEVIDTIVSVAVDKTRGKLLDAFKGFDATKASRMIEWIRARGIKPEPAALIAAIERVGRAANKARVADDAEFIVKQIEDIRSARAAAADPVESAKFVSGLLEGTVADPRVAFLITELKLTTAAVYNNATRRVARAEVERLTKLTEQQLKDLDRLRKVMERHVHERNALNMTQGETGK